MQQLILTTEVADFHALERHDILFGGLELFGLLPPESHANGEVRLVHKRQLALRKLRRCEHSYILAYN